MIRRSHVAVGVDTTNGRMHHALVKIYNTPRAGDVDLYIKEKNLESDLQQHKKKNFPIKGALTCIFPKLTFIINMLVQIGFTEYRNRCNIH